MGLSICFCLQIIGETNGQIVVSVRISNSTSFNPNVSIASATAIVSALNAAMVSNNGLFPFNVTVSAGNVATPVIQPFPVPAVTVTMTTTAIKTTPTLCPVADSTGLSSQGTVILAICMLVLGALIVIGLLLVVVCVRKCSSNGPWALDGSKPVSYKKHENVILSD